MASLKFLNKEYTVAGEGFNRWLVPASALMIHLCVGMGYGMSVFWLPMSRMVGISQGLGKPLSCDSVGVGIIGQLFTTSCDWKVTLCSAIFGILFFMLGTTTAILGNWLEHVGPRKCGLTAMVCFCSFFIIASVAMFFHQLWLAWIGAFIGGIGLGLGYITPVSTLIKWFPDRVGMSTGFAVGGFGGGAMCGAPMAQWLMGFFKTPTSTGLWQTFLTMGIVYCFFMLAGSFTIRVSPPGYMPAGSVPKNTGNMVDDGHGGLIEASAFNVSTSSAMRTPQFWLCWFVLFLNVSAGIGVISMASPLLQEVFAGNLIHLPGVPFDQLTDAQKGQVAVIAAGFTGLLSLFNIGGRIFWATMSDWIGRKNTYYIFAIVGAILYATIPSLASSLSLLFFLCAVCVCLSFYGGGFATIPAYLADLFGTQFVGAIHGRLLTAWSAAGLLSPLLINILRDMQIHSGVPRAKAYSVTLYIMACLLVCEFVCALLIRPVSSKYYMTEEEVSAAKHALDDKIAAAQESGVLPPSRPTSAGTMVICWLIVLIPLAYGIWQTALQTAKMFM
ncbi:MAG: OFA family MFS transporter [Burkholderiaceae bacterium]|jgi:MFS family permease|nr:OFA family MFS transporter [Burkholderiaceae bacterium]